jgi:putative FmdB family regulatory protein
MPIYEYACPSCEHRFSVLQRVGEGNDHLRCEQCGTPRPVKQISLPADSDGEHCAITPRSSGNLGFG